ncbi:ABC transporter substrate-binding protein [Halococcus dombrowskii]|uniref:ABC transporter substrate-binding protein n=1 Tax=Halococcus dombrowskii TaxID=179637 RepID=A0AAV3SKU5_HALDO|nr:ABC transporter substrate-binding protein [Halococcus dombrowskii]UOO95572.1 ABC transporter substrate-binding protein [Halococcus dombrowskii]
MRDDNSQTRRRFLKTTGGAAGALALAGCTGGGGGNDSGGNGSGGNGSGGANGSGGNGSSQQTQQNIEADPSKVLQRINSTITTFDPIEATDEASGYVNQQLYDMLMNYPDGKADPKKGLAKSFELSDDNTTYTFTLKDATFHNGDTVTAQDVVYSWERLAASSSSKRAYFILDSLGVKHETTTQDGEETYKPGSLGLNAKDEKTLEVTLSAPFHAAQEMMAYNSFAVLPEGYVGDIEGYDGEVSQQKLSTSDPVGAGPFKLKEWNSGTSAEVERFDDYHGGKASVAGVHWQIIEKASPVFNYAMNKNADVFGIPISQYDPSKVNVQRGPDDLGRQFGTYGPVRNGSTVQYLAVPEINTYYLGFDMSKVPKPVRQAFAYAANQQQLTKQVFKGRGEPAFHVTPKSIYPGGGSKAYKKHAKQNYPYGYNKTQLQKAKKVMKDAGYGPNNRFTVQWTQYQDDSWLSLAKLFRDQLSSAFIDMQIQQTPFATLTERGRSGKLEVYTLGWIADWPAPDNFLQLLNPPQTDTSSDAPLSYINWTPENGDAAKQASKAYKTVSNNQAPTKQAQQARNKAYVNIEEANWEDVGFLPLYHSLGERFAYNWVDIPPYGGMGDSRQMYNDVKIAKQRQ